MFGTSGIHLSGWIKGALSYGAFTRPGTAQPQDTYGRRFNCLIATVFLCLALEHMLRRSTVVCVGRAPDLSKISSPFGTADRLGHL